MNSALAALLVLLSIVGIPGVAASGSDVLPASGARGYLLTTLRGERIERIPLEFIGTIKDAVGPGYDLHLVKLEGPLAEQIGVASGMSGSPVFIDDQLIGALSFSMGALPKEPIAGVTPIEDMRAVFRARGGLARAAFRGATPIATPIAAGGLTAELAEWVGPQFEELGFVMVGGGDADQDSIAGFELRPGGPVGVELVRGDLSLAATGTVTWVEDDLVYAFGHPFLGSGPVEFPMVSAHVVHTLADLAGSFKLTNIGTELGAIIAQSTSGVASEALDAVRRQGVSLDNILARVSNRLVGRNVDDLPAGPPLLVERTKALPPAEGGSGGTLDDVQESA